MVPYIHVSQAQLTAENLKSEQCTTPNSSLSTAENSELIPRNNQDWSQIIPLQRRLRTGPREDL